MVHEVCTTQNLRKDHAGAEFKITDAIDPNIVKKLNEIRINIQTTSSEYAEFHKTIKWWYKF